MKRSHNCFNAYFSFSVVGTLLNPSLFAFAVLFILPQSSSPVLFSQTIQLISESSIALDCTPTRIDNWISNFANPWQQKEAIRQLIACGQIAVPALTKALQTKQEIEIREATATALGYIGGNTATEALIRALQTDPVATVRKTAAAALGHIRAKSAVRPLIVKLQQSNEDIYVRQEVAEALGAIADVTAVNSLIGIVKDLSQPLNLRQASVKALSHMEDLAIDALVTALKDPDIRTRYWAVVALTDINSYRAISALKTHRSNVHQILEAADAAGIIEFDRVPPAAIRVSTRIPKKPLLCKIELIFQNWSRCR